MLSFHVISVLGNHDILILTPQEGTCMMVEGTYGAVNPAIVTLGIARHFETPGTSPR